MSRTVLAAAIAMLIGLAACRGGRESRPAATRSKATAKPTTSTQQKKKTTAKPDTARAKNPLTNN